MAVQPRPGSRLDFSHPLAQGVVGWWEMNMGSGLVVPDLSAGQKDGTMTNMDAETDWALGEDGYALKFDGGNDCVACGNDTSLNPTANLTIAARVRFNAASIGNHQAMLGRWTGKDAGRAYYILALGSWGRNYCRIKVQDSGSAEYTAQNPAAVIAATWYSVVGTYVGGGRCKLYVDGIEVADVAAGVDIHAVTSNTLIGTFEQGAFPLDGDVEYVSIYDRALSADEVAWLYAEPHAPIWTPNPVWYFDTGGGIARFPAARRSLIARYGPRVLPTGVM